MIEPVDILGIGAEGPRALGAGAGAGSSAATFLAGGRRHLELVGPGAAETFAIGDNVAELVDRLRDAGPDERCVVLASGDPLFYGIGHRLGLELGRDSIRVEPAVSSMQLAFARAGLAWHDAAHRQRPRPAARRRPSCRCSAGPRSACSPRTGRAPRPSPRSSSTEGSTTTRPGSASGWGPLEERVDRVPDRATCRDSRSTP